MEGKHWTASTEKGLHQPRQEMYFAFYFIHENTVRHIETKQGNVSVIQTIMTLIFCQWHISLGFPDLKMHYISQSIEYWARSEKKCCICVVLTVNIFRDTITTSSVTHCIPDLFHITQYQHQFLITCTWPCTMWRKATDTIPYKKN